jgi:hypothetical protein
MNYQLPGNIKPEDVKKLVEDLRSLTGVKVEVSYVFTLNVEDSKVLKILDVLYGCQAPVKKVVKKKVEDDSIAHEKVAGLIASTKSWELMDGDKVVGKYSIEEKGQMLSRGKFQEGARLRYAKNGKYFTVSGPAGHTQKLEG